MALYLTTTDNPFSPVDDYEQWSRFDRDHGYNTDALVARIAYHFVVSCRIPLNDPTNCVIKRIVNYRIR